MSKFKVGDKVRRIRQPWPHSPFEGEVGRVWRYRSGLVPKYNVTWETSNEYHDYDCDEETLELVEPAQPADAVGTANEAGSDELDTLIAKANDGLAALARLSSRKDEVESRHRDGSVAPCHPSYEIFEVLYSHLASGYLAGEIQLRRKQKPRPQFAAFDTSNGWRVCLDVPHDEIHVGCQRFERKKLTEALRNLIDNNEDGTHVDGLDLGATRKGVEYIEYDGVTPERSHVLPWPDAEALYEALKKYEQELKP